MKSKTIIYKRLNYIPTQYDWGWTPWICLGVSIGTLLAFLAAWFYLPSTKGHESFFNKNLSYSVGIGSLVLALILWAKSAEDTEAYQRRTQIWTAAFLVAILQNWVLATGTLQNFEIALAHSGTEKTTVQFLLSLYGLLHFVLATFIILFIWIDFLKSKSYIRSYLLSIQPKHRTLTKGLLYYLLGLLLIWANIGLLLS